MGIEAYASDMGDLLGSPIHRLYVVQKGIDGEVSGRLEAESSNRLKLLAKHRADSWHQVHPADVGACLGPKAEWAPQASSRVRYNIKRHSSRLWVLPMVVNIDFGSPVTKTRFESENGECVSNYIDISKMGHKLSTCRVSFIIMNHSLRNPAPIKSKTIMHITQPMDSVILSVRRSWLPTAWGLSGALACSPLGATGEGIPSPFLLA